MKFFSPNHESGKIYVDENRKIKWIWASLNKEKIQTILTDTRLLKKTVCYALAAGALTGIILSFI